MAEEDRTTQYTDIQLQFLKLLQKYPVKNPETVVDYVTSQGETVLEDPEKLARSLSECEITPVRRRQILKHWFAEKGVDVPPELLQRVTLPPERRKEIEEREESERESKKSKYSVDEDTGVIKVATSGEKALTMDEAKELARNIKKELTEKRKASQVTYVYDTETGQVRMAKEGEMGGTLEQAKELKRMAEEGKKGAEETESPFIMDEQGNWTLNPKARVTGVELMAFESIRRSQDRGEPVDPLEALSQAADKMRVFQEALGGGARQLPEWMTDPSKFIETVRTISGEGKGDEGVKAELAELRTTLKEMQEQRHREEIAGLQAQVRQQGEAHERQIGSLMDRMEEMSKPVTGRTEMDIIHEVATGMLDEIKGARGDVKSYVLSQGLPQPKTSEEREARRQRYRTALAADKEIEGLGKRLFFGEQVTLPSEAPRKEPPAPPATPREGRVEQKQLYRKGEMGKALF